MNKKSYQEPLTIEQQISNLKQIGLIVENENEAAEFLNDVSYFRLIKAYGVGLKEKTQTFKMEQPLIQ